MNVRREEIRDKAIWDTFVDESKDARVYYAWGWRKIIEGNIKLNPRQYNGP